MYESLVGSIHGCIQLLCRALLRVLQWLPLGWHDRAAVPLNISRRSISTRFELARASYNAFKGSRGDASRCHHSIVVEEASVTQCFIPSVLGFTRRFA